MLELTQLSGFGIVQGGPLSFINHGSFDGIAIGGGNTITWTIGAGGEVSAGQVLWTGIALNGINKTLSSVADTKGNAWTVDATVVNGSGAGSHQASMVCTTPLVAGDVITLTFSGSLLGLGGAAGAIGLLVNAAASSPKDQSATNTGTGTATNSATGATAQAKEIVMGLASWNISVASLTGDGAYTTIALISIGGSKSAFWGYKVVAAAGAQDMATGNASASWAQTLVTYKGN